MRERIIERFPEHTCYVEVFCGAGWVLFGKEPSRVEVINDVDGELVNFYRVLKHRPAEFAEQFHLELISRQLFKEYRRFEEGKTELERAMRFYYVLRLCFGGRRQERNFGTKTLGTPGLNLSRLYFQAQQFSSRLERVVIENVTWEKCLAIYDRPHTLFYLDPPYPANNRTGSAQSGEYVSNMNWEQHEALAEALLKLKGKWLLSYRDHPRLVAALSPPWRLKAHHNRAPAGHLLSRRQNRTRPPRARAADPELLKRRDGERLANENGGRFWHYFHRARPHFHLSPHPTLIYRRSLQK